MKRLILVLVTILSIFSALYSCEAKTYNNKYYGFSFVYPDSYSPIHNPSVLFQVQNGNNEFHIIVNDKNVSQLYNYDEFTFLKKAVDKFYAEVATNAYAPYEFKILKHYFTTTNDGKHKTSIVHYAMFTPSGEGRYCMLGTILSRGVVYSIYYVVPNPTVEEMKEAEFCLRSFVDN